MYVCVPAHSDGYCFAAFADDTCEAPGRRYYSNRKEIRVAVAFYKDLKSIGYFKVFKIRIQRVTNKIRIQIDTGCIWIQKAL